MSKTTTYITATLLSGALHAAALAAPAAGVSAQYKALKCPAPGFGSTWAIGDRNGGNTKVEPYLSSLGKGETGTGIITSPPFVIASDSITFTICGHDGQQGGRGQNYIALVDARKGNTLMKTAAPGHDALQPRSWDVRKLKKVEVRIEVHDGNNGSGFAWLGIGQIDAGPALSIDFRNGMPEAWDRPPSQETVRYEPLTGGIPFQRHANAYTLIPPSGSVEIPCGFRARRLYVLGCTVSNGKALTTYGTIEVHYASGKPDIFPLLCGFTLDGTHKLLSRSKAMHLHPSTDPFQPYLAIKPREAKIEKIRLTAQATQGPFPRITAVTCETKAESEHLMPLPESTPSTRETAWINKHTLSTDAPKLDRIKELIRNAQP